MAVEGWPENGDEETRAAAKEGCKKEDTAGCGGGTARPNVAAAWWRAGELVWSTVTDGGEGIMAAEEAEVMIEVLGVEKNTGERKKNKVSVLFFFFFFFF